jgi:hypothetical protein
MNHDIISGLACIFCMCYILALLFNFYSLYSETTRKLFSIVLIVCFIYFLGEYTSQSMIDATALKEWYSLMVFSGLVLLITHIHGMSVKFRRKTLVEEIEKTKQRSALPLQTLGNVDILNSTDSLVQSALQNGVTRRISRYILITEVVAWSGFAVSIAVILYTLFPYLKG